MKKCKLCGDPAPEEKELCWCCEHTRLHPIEPRNEEAKCSDDACRMEVTK